MLPPVAVRDRRARRARFSSWHRRRRYSTTRSGAFWAVLLALWLVPISALAAGDPDLDWWTIETRHFRIHYAGKWEPIAERVARLAEQIHGRLTGPLGYSPKTATELVITDYTDSANGSATAYPYNTVRLFVSAPGDLSSLGDYDDWYLDLLTHEYTHILHVDNISGVPSVVNAVLGKTLVPNQLQPRWILEGLAVLFESKYTSGGRLRGTSFDMSLRADVLADNIASLDQISSSARRWPQRTLWYLYGSEFMRWITDVYGPNTIRAVAVDYGASLAPWGINRAIRRVTGRTYEQLYEGFKADIKRRYRKQMRQVRRRGLREGRRLTFHGRQVSYPRFLPPEARRGSGRYQLFYHRNDMHNRPGVYYLQLATDDDGKRPAEQLIARTSGASPVGFGPDGALFFASVVPWRNVYQRTDLFRLPAGKRATAGTESFRQRLTRGWRAAAPTVSPNGRQIAFTVNHHGTTTLQIADLTPDAKLRRRRTLVPCRRFEQAYTPAFSPDNRRLAYSAWTTGGYRDIRIVDVTSGKLTQVTHDRSMDTGPSWSPDGRKLYFSSDRTGIANIYEYSLNDGRLRQVTNVRTGAFMPTVSEDGRVLVYVGYTSAGYDLYGMRLVPARFLDALPPPVDRPDPPAQPPEIPLKKRRYQPWPTLRPYSWMFDYKPGNFGGNALTITTTGQDVVGHHTVAASLVVDPAAPLPQLALNYTYGRLPVDMTLSLSNTVVPRTDYRINNARRKYLEKVFGVRSGVSYTHLGEFTRQTVGLSYAASAVEADLPVDSVGPLDPYASVTQLPQGGLITFVHAGYAVSNAEYSFETAGLARGFSLNLGFDLGDTATGSEESIYAASYQLHAYIPMPWPGYHTLALRSAGAMAGGSYARRGFYYVGGYDLENTDLLDTLIGGVFNGSFALRGYPPGVYSGRTYLLETLEYRFPIAQPDIGPSTLPIYLRRIDGNLFLDYGGAFNDLDFKAFELFSKGALIYSPQMHTSVGFETWIGTTIAYVVDLQLRLGYAYGFSAEAEPEGQWYFIGSSAF